jgi:hypothetical protein
VSVETAEMCMCNLLELAHLPRMSVTSFIKKENTILLLLSLLLLLLLLSSSSSSSSSSTFLALQQFNWFSEKYRSQ